MISYRHVTATAVEGVLAACAQLEYLDVSYCDKIGVEEVALLQALFPHIAIKHVETLVQRSLEFR